MATVSQSAGGVGLTIRHTTLRYVVYQEHGVTTPTVGCVGRIMQRYGI